jgi:predicted DNA-binding transcriptional regulator YafY
MDETPKRFDRIVSILIQLQSKRVVKAHELAQRFEVSLRTIYRDIRTLEASGVPLYSEAGIGYSLMEGYRLPPVMFTREEASSFIAAEKLMQKFTDKELARHYTSAAIKLKAVLQLPDKDWISNIESNILMQPRSNMFGEESPNALAVLFKSIAEKMQVTLSYQPSDARETTARIIEPVGIFHDHNNWYTLAFCHLRNEYRQFRTDRIHQIDMTAAPFTKEHPALELLLKKDKKEVPTTKVRILVEKSIANYLEYEKKYHGFVSEKHVGDHIEMSFLSPNIEDAFCRWYLMFGDCATILEPERLKVRVLELIKATESKLSQAVS